MIIRKETQLRDPDVGTILMVNGGFNNAKISADFFITLVSLKEFYRKLGNMIEQTETELRAGRSE